MPEPRRIEDLDIAEDLTAQWRLFRIQRVAIPAMVVLVIAGLLGLLGRSGPLSDTAAGEADAALSAGYQRFLRLQTSTDLELRVREQGGEMTNVAIKSAYLEGFRIESVRPQPDSVTQQPDRTVYTFDLEPPSTVSFTLRPQEIGVQQAFVALDDERVEFRQLVYP